MGLSVPPLIRATARRGVVLVYAVPPEEIAPSLPAGLTPDTWNGRAYIHLAAVELVDVRVLGVSAVGPRRLPVVECRCPVEESRSSSDRKGTYALQMLLPKRFFAWGARNVAGEPAATVPIEPVYRARRNAVEMTYRFEWNGREQRIRAVCEITGERPEGGSLPAFTLRRDWRYGTRGTDTLLRTRIEGPPGAVHFVDQAHVALEWTMVVGDHASVVDGEDPVEAWFDRGGPVTLSLPTGA